MQVFETLGPTKARLGFRVTISFERIYKCELSNLGQTRGDFFRLIELSFS